MSGTHRPAGRRAPRPGGATANGSLYERYKDALRRGHVAALRGRNEAAVDAYGEAASIAPDRALPHASIGGILAKMDRLDDAVAAYDRALALAQRDENALRGLADVQLRTGRRTDAAATLDRLADSLDAAGRLADATDAARRALELAESRARRRQVEGFASRLRTASSGDEGAQRALDQALRLLEPAGPVDDDGAASDESEGAPERVGESDRGGVAAAASDDAVAVASDDAEATASAEADGEGAEPAAEVGARAEPDPAAPDTESAAEAASDAGSDLEAEPVRGQAGPAAEIGAEPESPSETAAEAETVPEPEPVPEPAGLGIALGAAAEAALHAGDFAAAHDGLLAAARAHRRAGRLSAALDACYLAIGLAPSDPDLHLLLTELYLDRGWRSQAVEKLLLLGRLADLDGNRAVRDRLCVLVTERLADEPRVADLCA